MRLISGALLFAGVYAQQPDAIVDFEVQLAPGAPVETFAVHVYRKWAPLGASRFLKLVDDGHFDGCAFFRVINRFMAQFGINGDPERQVAEEVDPGRGGENTYQNQTRAAYYICAAGPNSRSTQLFINFGDNSRLAENFPPFWEVEEEGMSVVDRLHVTGEGLVRRRSTTRATRICRRSSPSSPKSSRRGGALAVPHRKGDIDGDGKLDGKDTAIFTSTMRGCGARRLAPVAPRFQLSSGEGWRRGLPSSGCDREHVFRRRRRRCGEPRSAKASAKQDAARCDGGVMFDFHKRTTRRPRHHDARHLEHVFYRRR